MGKTSYTKCIKDGVFELELNKIYEVFDEDEHYIEVKIGRKTAWKSKECFEPYEKELSLEEVNDRILELSKELYKLKKQKEDLEKEELKIQVGSIICSESMYDDCVDEYTIIMIQTQPVRDYKFALVDETNCVWFDQVFDSIDNIKTMMRTSQSEKWTVVRI